MIAYSSSSESSSETDNEQTQGGAQSAVFCSEKLTSLQPTADDDAGSDDDAQYSVGTEGSGLPRPAWMDASSQDSSTADARVQSIRDIIRVSSCPFL